MSKQVVVIRVNSDLYEAFRDWCHARGLGVDFALGVAMDQLMTDRDLEDALTAAAIDGAGR